MALTLCLDDEEVCLVRRSLWRRSGVEVWCLAYRDIGSVSMTEPHGRRPGVLALLPTAGDGQFTYSFGPQVVPEMRTKRREIWRRAQAAAGSPLDSEPPD